MSDRRARLISRLKNRAKDGKTIFNNITIPQPVDNRTPQQKRIDREIAKKKEEEDAIKLIEENKEKIFNLSFEKQDWEHEWNLEEYQKDRIWRYEDEYPRDESYEGVAQWCICYKCRPEWHSQLSFNPAVQETLHDASRRVNGLKPNETQTTNLLTK